MDRILRDRISLLLSEIGWLGCFASLVKSCYVWSRYASHFGNHLPLPLLLNRTAEVQIRQGALVEFQESGRLFVGVSFVGSASLNHDVARLHIGSGGKLQLGGNVFLGPGVRVDIGKGARLSIGARTEFANSSTVVCKRELVIGDGCFVAAGTIIRDTDAHTLIDSHQEGREVAKRTIIGNHVWIGNRVIVLKGITVGNGAMLGAGSVVTRDVPPYTLVGGNPARVIREGIHWER